MEPARRWRRGGGTGADDGSPLGGKGGRSVCCRTNSTSFKLLMFKIFVSTRLTFIKTVSLSEWILNLILIIFISSVTVKICPNRNSKV